MQRNFSPVFASAQANALYAYDFTSGRELIGVKQDVPLPLASLTKLMTVRLVAKNVSLDTLYTVLPEDLIPEGSVGFAPGESYRIGDLMRAALIKSSNEAAVMLARSTGLSEEAFATAMNLEAQNLGLTSLHYGSVTGLDIEDVEATAVGSARDMLNLMYRDYVDFPQIAVISATPTETIQSIDGTRIELVNTNKVIERLPLLVASKTGYTKSALGNLAILWREPAGNVLGAVVLGSTENGRFDDMVALHTASNRYIADTRLEPKECAKILE